MSICYNHYLQYNRVDNRGVTSSNVFPATDWLTSDQSLFIFRQASYHIPNVPVTFRLQTRQPPTNNRSPSGLLVLKTCVHLNLRLIADKPLIGMRYFLYLTDQTPIRIQLKAGESPMCLVVGGSTASHGSVAGLWPVNNRNQRKVIGAIGGWTAIGRKFHRSKRPMTNFKPVELLSSDDFAWSELICRWQATNRSMAGSYKSAFRSVSGHPPASVEGGY